MKCRNSAFNAQGLETDYSSCTSKSTVENICSRSSGGAQEKKERQDEMKLSLPPKLVGKT